MNLIVRFGEFNDDNEELLILPFGNLNVHLVYL
jgi:hypothetical protein